MQTINCTFIPPELYEYKSYSIYNQYIESKEID